MLDAQFERLSVRLDSWFAGTVTMSDHSRLLDRYDARFGRHITLATATLRDLPDIMNAQNSLFPNDLGNYSEEQMVQLLGSKTCRCVIATYKGKFAGFVILINRPFRPWTSADTLGVLHEFAGKCIGAYLVKEGMQRFGYRPLVKLAVRESNVSALRLYERFGFKRIGSKKQKLSDEGNAVVMMAATRNTYFQPILGHAMRADL